VALSKDELSSLDPKKSRAIEVQDFVDLSEIDPIYFDSPYYLGPAEGAEKAYSLLAQAMEGSGKVAIARFVFRNKEHLAAIRPADGVLTLTTMRFAEEVVGPSELKDALPAEKPKVAKREVEMAEKLIDSLTRRFDPGSYRDEHREELLALIERKAEGKELLQAPVGDEREATKAPDLMAALEESIAALQGRDRAEKEGTKKRPAASKKKPAPKRAASRAKSKSSK
jgi:DNA end-binding protein Ku